MEHKKMQRYAFFITALIATITVIFCFEMFSNKTSQESQNSPINNHKQNVISRYIAGEYGEELYCLIEGNTAWLNTSYIAVFKDNEKYMFVNTNMWGEVYAIELTVDEYYHFAKYIHDNKIDSFENFYGRVVYEGGVPEYVYLHYSPEFKISFYFYAPGYGNKYDELVNHFQEYVLR